MGCQDFIAIYICIYHKPVSVKCGSYHQAQKSQRELDSAQKETQQTKEKLQEVQNQLTQVLKHIQDFESCADPLSRSFHPPLMVFALYYIPEAVSC